MGAFTQIFKGLVAGDPVKSITELIGEFHMSPEQTAQIQQAAQALEVQRDQIEAARDEALAGLQSKNITAETQSEDPYVRRARPTFLYVMIIGIAFSIVIFPILNLVTHRGLQMVEIPAGYLDLFGVSFLGYTGARTWEKTRGTSGDIQSTLQIHADRLNLLAEKQAAKN
ncbi:MAG TPA: 3TM-type holin [Terriglobia bacterium]|nr:3TM-type holin [Terriglobia bacterium]